MWSNPPIREAIVILISQEVTLDLLMLKLLVWWVGKMSSSITSFLLPTLCVLWSFAGNRGSSDRAASFRQQQPEPNIPNRGKKVWDAVQSPFQLVHREGSIHWTSPSFFADGLRRVGIDVAGFIWIHPRTHPEQCLVLLRAHGMGVTQLILYAFVLWYISSPTDQEHGWTSGKEWPPERS